MDSPKNLPTAAQLRQQGVKQLSSTFPNVPAIKNLVEQLLYVLERHEQEIADLRFSVKALAEANKAQHDPRGGSGVY